MKTRKPKPESEQSIPEMVDELTRLEIATWYKDDKLAPFGQRGGNLAKLVAAF